MMMQSTLVGGNEEKQDDSDKSDEHGQAQTYTDRHGLTLTGTDKYEKVV